MTERLGPPPPTSSVQRILERERAYMEEKGLPSSLPQGGVQISPPPPLE